MLSRFDKYLNQDASWQQQTGSYDDYGNALHSDPQTIKVRKVSKTKIVKDKYGKEIVSTTTVMTTDAVETEDLIDGRLVISTDESRDRSGGLIGKLAYL